VAVGIGTAITLFSTVMSGCSFLNSPKLVSNWSVQDARSLTIFRYWLGDSYNGLPLAAAQQGTAQKPSGSWQQPFVYYMDTALRLVGFPCVDSPRDAIFMYQLGRFKIRHKLKSGYLTSVPSLSLDRVFGD
jgi:hypothetical protein